MVHMQPFKKSKNLDVLSCRSVCYVQTALGVKWTCSPCAAELLVGKCSLHSHGFGVSIVHEQLIKQDQSHVSCWMRIKSSLATPKVIFVTVQYKRIVWGDLFKCLIFLHQQFKTKREEHQIQKW